MAEVTKIEVNNQFLIDRLSKLNSIHAPSNSIGQEDPINALVCRVVDRLPDVLILEFETNCLDFDQRSNYAVDFGRKVAVIPPNCILCSDVTSEYLS